MKDYKKSAKITLYITYLLMFLLVVFAVVLPYGTTWYVDTMGRPEDLARVVMLTCYPCVPLAAIALISLKRFVKNIINDSIATRENMKNLKALCYCCIIAGGIMLAAGHFYMPFFISSGSALFCGVVIKAVYDALANYVSKKEG